MNILFITSNRLGDAVLSTGIPDRLSRTYPGASITVACGRLAASLFEGLPGLDGVIVLDKKPFKRHWLDLWLRTAARRWDMVVDLRNSAVSRLLRADKRYVFGPHIDQRLHKVRQNAAVAGWDEDPPAPAIWPSPAQTLRARALVPEGGPVLALGPAANWIGKTWPAARFADLAGRLTAADGPMPGARVAVFAAPGEEGTAGPVLASVPEARRVDMIARADPGTAAAAMALCRAYIGNDSGLMHCAAAAGIPTLGLFGPGFPEIYGPWGEKARVVRTPETHVQLTSFPGYDPRTLERSLMESLTVDSVYDAAAALLRETEQA